GSGGGSGSGGHGGHGGGEEKTSGGGGGNGGGHGGSGGGPAQRVTLTVSTVRSSYTGSCPPPPAAAPAFSAVIRVTRLPAKVEYQWYTRSGKGTDLHWKTLDYPADGAKERTVNHTETLYSPADTRTDQIALKVRAPHQLQSEHLEFSITCESTQPPSGYQSQ
ncbi:serine/threonine protein kinase, partial [Streptomyces sp. SB3404]|nr:serine/threonine protein kinase [Streptomyces boncukensis]